MVLPGSASLGRGPPGFGPSLGRVPPPPPPPAPILHGNATFNALSVSERVDTLTAQEDHSPQKAGVQAVIQVAVVHLQVPRPHSSQEEQVLQVAIHRPDLQPHLHPASLDRSRKPLPKLSLPSNYKSCNILDMQQLLEVWYDRSTFAIATW